MDPGYTTLINLLQRPNDTLQTLPDQTLHGAVTHYLNVLPIIHIPALVRTLVISQTLWNTRTWVHLSGILVAVRQSLHLKRASLGKLASSGYIYEPDIRTPLKEWVNAILEGLGDSGHNVQQVCAKLAVLGGLLQGLEDIKPDINLRRLHNSVRDRVATTCHSLVDLSLGKDKSSWGSEFNVFSLGDENVSSIVLCLLSSVLPLVPGDRLQHMYHEGIISACLEAYKRTFKDGSLFTGVDQVGQHEGSKWDFLPESNLPQEMVSVSQDTVFKSLAPICKLMSRSLMLLADLRSQAAWVLMGQVVKALDSISIGVEHSWSSSALSMVSDEDALATTIRPTTQQLWNAFKTLLFSTVLIFQSIIDVVILQNSPRSTISGLPSSGGLASEILGTLFHLSFISSKFGGLTAEGGGFTEQKRTFFAALDIISGDLDASEALLGSLISNSDGASEAVRRSRAAFFLACAEQLIPAVGDNIIESSILPFAKTFLDDPSHRETFESAHSVLLGVFSNNGNRIRGSMHYGPDRRETLALRLTPFYLASLLNNATEGRLSTEQLRLAFHSVVRSTSASGDDAAAWMCIDALLKALNLVKEQPNAAAQLHRLRLTLISLISAVNLPLLGQLFIEVDKEIMVSEAEESQEKEASNMRGELIEEVHSEVMSRVGDAQKQVSLEWWLNLRERLGTALPEL